MSKEHKERIQQQINAFATGNLADNAIALFKELGYKSNKRIALDKDAFKSRFDECPNANKKKYLEKAYFNDWLSGDYLFQLTESEITRQLSLFSVNQYNPDEYQSYSFVAVELKNEHCARGILSQITREVNKLFPMPVIILFKHGSLLTLSVINRRLHKRDDSKDVLEKVTLVKDIRISPAGWGARRTEVEVPLKKGGEGVVTHRAHIEILFDLSFGELSRKHAIQNFKQLHDAWQKTLDTKELNKRFYEKLFYWYLWAVKKVKFPQIRPKEDLIPDEAHQSESVIRLLTRLLFCWFMKEKQELIPELLFDKKEVKKILIDFSPENEKSSVFYRAILQNLFFATLSVPIKNRKYIRESFQGKNQDYGNPYVYRYQSEFADAKENLKLFKDIPFLNGGLFECLDEVPENDDEKEIRLDGFSSKEEKQAFVPDYLFWDEHNGIDLSEELDNPRKKNETIYGIIDILNSYKFTIEENTPLEEEVALDPELLGRVFESLLAYYNPETKANARKQTGSFYTPREIVNYMVDESLIAALQQKLSNAGITEHVELRLRNLISYNETENPFTEKETNVIIQALENLKVLDPACGSGAFPMGMLHKLVWILRKVDPENKIWFESIIKRLPTYAQPEMRKKLEGENWDYLRKLGVVQQSVYGVDIQPIAIQIAKLRFFISLLVDQDIKGNEENNFGLLPLPNLDFKLVSANTLIGAPEHYGRLPFAQDQFFDTFNKLTGQYFGTYEPAEKKTLTKKIKNLVSGKVQEKVAEIQRLSTHADERFSKHVAEKNKVLIEQKKNDAKLWNSYNNLFKHESVEFFEIKYFFPEVKEGFDVVIANPPYGSDIKDTLEKLEATYQYYDRQKNSASFFIELASRLVKNNGVVTYIVPKSLSFSEGWQKTRKLIADKYRLLTLVDVSKAFDAVLLEQIIISFIKSKSNSYEFNTGEGWNSTINSIGTVSNSLIKEHDTLPVYIDKAKLRILDKISKQSILLPEISYTFRGLPLQRNISEKGLAILRGRNIGKYKIYGKIDKISLPQELINSKKIKDILLPKIVSQNIVAHVLNPYDRIIIMATLDKEPFLTLDTVMNTVMTNDKFAIEYVISILNSKLASWFYYWFVYNRSIRTMHFDKYYIGKLPIKNVNLSNQKPFINLVDQIFAIKQKDPQADTLALESQIDVMIYKLYGLTYEEVKIIEPEFAISEVGYEAFDVK